jgi:hypothetical protein
MWGTGRGNDPTVRRDDRAANDSRNHGTNDSAHDSTHDRPYHRNESGL